MSVKKKLQVILKKKGSRNYTKGLKEDKTLLSILKKQFGDLSLPELFYLGLNNNIQQYCQYGKRKSFKNIEEGYRNFCGMGKDCLCRCENQSEKMKKKWEERTQEEKDTLWNNYQQTMLQIHGVENPMFSPVIREKTENTNLDRHGAKTPFESEKIQNKIKSKNLKKLGVEYPLQNQDVRMRAEETTIQRYGALMTHARAALCEIYNGNPFEIDEIQQKAKQTMLNKYGVEHALQVDEFLESARRTLYQTYGRHNPAQLSIPDNAYDILMDEKQFCKCCEKYSLRELSDVLCISTDLILSYHEKYDFDIYFKRYRSLYEEEIAKWLDDLGINYIRNYPIHNKYSVDFYLIDYSLAIEFHGLYYHCEFLYKNKKYHEYRGKDYHYNKYKMCKDKNIQCIQIFEDEWNQKKKIVKNIIKSKMGLLDKGNPARKCVISIIDNKTANCFLKQYHLLGAPRGSTENLGAYNLSGVLVAVVTLKKNNQSLEMTRYCLDDKIHIGLFSKFTSFITKNFIFDKLITFADLRYSNGYVYSKNRWVNDQFIKPDYAYTNYIVREHKFRWRKDRIIKRFNLNLDKNQFTEWELVQMLKWNRIWDVGKLRFIWPRK